MINLTFFLHFHVLLFAQELAAAKFSTLSYNSRAWRIKPTRRHGRKWRRRRWIGQVEPLWNTVHGTQISHGPRLWNKHRWRVWMYSSTSALYKASLPCDRLLLTFPTTSLSSRLLAAVLLWPAEVLHDGRHKHPYQPQGGRPCQVPAPQDWNLSLWTQAGFATTTQT